MVNELDQRFSASRKCPIDEFVEAAELHPVYRVWMRQIRGRRGRIVGSLRGFTDLLLATGSGRALVKGNKSDGDRV